MGIWKTTRLGNLNVNMRCLQQRAVTHISCCAVIVAVFAVLMIINSPYLGWDYSDPETAVFGAAFHAFEWLYVRIAPIIFVGGMIGVFLTREKG